MKIHSNARLTRATVALGLCAGALMSSGAWAQTELARVISSTPIIQQVGITRDVCQDEVVTAPGQKSGAGALMGGLAGGAMGNAIGDGSGRAAATVLGIVGGAVLGNRIEGDAPPQSRIVKRCQPQTFYENRTAGYHVVYELGGKQYSVQMPQDPGTHIQIQLTPIAPLPAPTPVLR